MLTYFDRISPEAYFSLTSYDYSTNKKNIDNSIVKLRLKESPNYLSIMDLWGDQQNYTNSKLSTLFYRLMINFIVHIRASKNITTSYFTKEADEDEMGNTDEGVSYEERLIPHMGMLNLVQAIWSKKIPEELNQFLKSSTRFRITSVNSNLNSTPKNMDGVYSSGFSMVII